MFDLATRGLIDDFKLIQEIKMIFSQRSVCVLPYPTFADAIFFLASIDDRSKIDQAGPKIIMAYRQK
jgi:hypothetical protein